MAERLDKILRAGAVSVETHKYLGELKRESPATQEINEDFSFIAKNYKRYSCYETRPVPRLVDHPIVGRDSACMGKGDISRSTGGGLADVCTFRRANARDHHHDGGRSPKYLQV